MNKNRSIFPKEPKDKKEIHQYLQALKQADIPWQSGKVLAYIYQTIPEAHEIAHSAYALYLTENGIDPTQFPSLLHLERSVIAMTADLLNGGPLAVGNCTSGGTESVLLAVKTARDRARDLFPHISDPEIIMPKTAHGCFIKAGHYLNVKVKEIPVDKETFRADVKQMQAAITDQTIMLVGSAPSYTHAVIDDIEAIAALAKANKLLCHVDACVGGMFIPFAKMLNYPLPAFDFSVEGVTSISCDLHKFGYVPKGCSTIIYRSKELRQYQVFSTSSGPSYSVVNPTVLSTRSGGPIAAAWSMFHFLGVEGYKNAVKDCMEAKALLVKGLNEIPELSLLGKPDISMLSFVSTSEDINVFELAERMKSKGWYLQTQLKSDISDAGIHISITHFNVPHIAGLVKDLKASIQELKSEGEEAKQLPLDPNMLKAMMANFTPDMLHGFTALLGSNDQGVPVNFVAINKILNTLSPSERDKLLVAFMNKLFSNEA